MKILCVPHDEALADNSCEVHKARGIGGPQKASAGSAPRAWKRTGVDGLKDQNWKEEGNQAGLSLLTAHESPPLVVFNMARPPSDMSA